jgi:hypothetical protein
MSEFKRVKSELFEGTVAKIRPVIQAHRSIAEGPVEREFDLRWAQELKTRILRGWAVSFFWAVADMPLGGKIVRLRMNGNHSGWALEDILRDGEFTGSVAIHLDTYSVSDQAAAVLLFRQFDDRRSSRSKEDISGAYQCFHDGIRGCKRRAAKLAIEGAAWYRREVQGIGVPTGDELYTMFNEERLHPFVQMVDSTLDDKCRELQRVPIVAAMYGTWLADAKRSAEFWRLTALGTKRNVEDAAADLDTELTRIKEDKEKIKAAELYAKCIKAWPAYLDGARVANFRVNLKKGLPDVAA